MMKRILMRMVIVGLASMAAISLAVAEPPRDQAPGYYRIKLGSLVVTALSDGTFKAPVEQLLIGAAPGEVQAALSRDFLTSPVDASVNCFLIDDGERQVLIDAGAGPLLGPTLGHLATNLEAAGYKAEDIDAVLITHFHPDHIGGLSHDGTAVFTNATVYIARADYELAYSGALPVDIASPIQAALEPYRAADRIKTIDGEADIFPGIRAKPSPGHTPGHTLFDISSEGSELLLWADTVHVAAVQMADPAVGMQFDLDPAAAQKSRGRLLQQTSKAGTLVAGAHLDFPGIGHVRQDGDHFDFVPVAYAPLD